MYVSIYLQIHEEENTSKMQDIINNVRRLTNQINFHKHLCCYFSSLFFLYFYDNDSLI